MQGEHIMLKQLGEIILRCALLLTIEKKPEITDPQALIAQVKDKKILDLIKLLTLDKQTYAKV